MFLKVVGAEPSLSPERRSSPALAPPGAPHGLASPTGGGRRDCKADRPEAQLWPGLPSRTGGPHQPPPIPCLPSLQRWPGAGSIWNGEGERQLSGSVGLAPAKDSCCPTTAVGPPGGLGAHSAPHISEGRVLGLAASLGWTSQALPLACPLTTLLLVTSEGRREAVRGDSPA